MIGFEDTEINCAGHQAPSHASCGGLEGKCSCWPNNWHLMMIPRCCITATRRDARTWWLREDGMVACVKGEIFLYKLGNIFDCGSSPVLAAEMAVVMARASSRQPLGPGLSVVMLRPSCFTTSRAAFAGLATALATSSAPLASHLAACIRSRLCSANLFLIEFSFTHLKWQMVSSSIYKLSINSVYGNEARRHVWRRMWHITRDIHDSRDTWPLRNPRPVFTVLPLPPNMSHVTCPMSLMRAPV